MSTQAYEDIGINQLRSLCSKRGLSLCTGKGIGKKVLIKKLKEADGTTKKSAGVSKALAAREAKKVVSVTEKQPDPQALYKKREGVVAFFDVASVPKRTDLRYLSNFAPSVFLFDGRKYLSTEHAFMYQKAVLFNDKDIMKAMEEHAETIDPTESIAAMETGKEGVPVLKVWKKAMMRFKSLGRKVQGYDDTVWQSKRYGVMKQVNSEKYKQNKALMELLLSTDNSILAESAPRDPVWGTGKGELATLKGPEFWREGALNLQGMLLMELRDAFHPN